MKMPGSSRHPVLLYAFLITIALAVLTWLSVDDQPRYPFMGPDEILFLFVYQGTPALLAILILRVRNHQPVADLGVQFVVNRWWGACFILMPVLAILTTCVGALWPGVTIDTTGHAFLDRLAPLLDPDEHMRLIVLVALMPVSPIVTTFFEGLVVGSTLYAFLCLGEELGWRGYVHHYLRNRGFWVQSYVSGLIWAMWSLPLAGFAVTANQFRPETILAVGLLRLALAPVFTYLRIKTGSVLAVAIMHGQLYGLSRVPLILLSGGGLHLIGVEGACGIIASTILVAGLWVFDRHWASEPIMSTRDTNRTIHPVPTA
jgi:membrane protease YdiL (CAAX protease family)